MNKKVTDILAYIGLIGWLIAFLAGTKEESKFHLNQGLVLAIAEIALSVIVGVCAFIPVVGLIVSLVGGVAGIVLFVFWIMGLIAAIQGEEKALPIIGGITLLK